MSLGRTAIDSKKGSSVFSWGSQDERRETRSMGKPEMCFNNFFFLYRDQANLHLIFSGGILKIETS